MEQSKSSLYVLVDDHGVDCIIKKGDGIFIEIQIKAGSSQVADIDAVLFSAIMHSNLLRFCNGY